MPLIVLAFVVVPLVELAVILQVGQLIGTWPTIALLLVVSVVGAALVKLEGVRAWWRFREALAAARVPAAEVVDGALILFAGALMLTPGFLTDAVGLLLLLPPTRALARRAIRRRVRLSVGMVGRPPPPRRPRQGTGRPAAGRAQNDDDVVDVEVVDVRRDDLPPGAA